MQKKETDSHRAVKVTVSAQPFDQKAIDEQIATRVLGLTLQARPDGRQYWAQPDRPDTLFITAEDWNPCVDTSPYFLPQNQWMLVMERMVELGFRIHIGLGYTLPKDWETKTPKVYQSDHFMCEVKRSRHPGNSIICYGSSLAEAVCLAALAAVNEFDN